MSERVGAGVPGLAGARLRDETGIAMGLAVVLIVVIGVMGAGLLVFVRNDLQAVVETNQGQEAFEATDAGMQAAERQLLSDNCPESYGGPEDEGDNGCEPRESSEDWHEDGGKELDFGGSEIDVRITYLPFPGEEDTNCENEDVDDPDCAPEDEQEDDERHFFLVESEGESGSGNARRKAEGILYTYDLGVPRAYYSRGDIDISGTADIDDVSLFSEGDVDIANNAEINGTDEAYGDWQNEYNDEPRDTDEAGIGALGDIDGGEADRDYDSGTTPPFVEDPDGDDMTFPFDPDTQEGSADDERIDFLRDEAIRQEDQTNEDHYIEISGNGNEDLDDWPSNSDENTVVFAEFTSNDSSNTLKWDVPGDCEDDPDDSDYDPKKGTLVVENGNFTTSQNQALLQGVVLVRGGEADGDSDDTGGNTCLDGFVNASGEVKIAGSVSPFTSDDSLERPGFYGVETWSWRELYE